MLSLLIKSLAFLIFLASSQFVFAEKLTFSQVYERARESALDFNLARYQVDAAEAREQLGLSKLLPQLNLFGQFSENDIEYETNTVTPDATFAGKRYGMQMTQPIFSVADSRELRRLKFIRQKTEQELLVSKTDLLIQTAEAFLNVTAADATLIQSQDELAAVDKQLEEAEALFARKLIAITEVLDARSRVDTLRADVISASGEAAIARERLFQLTGHKNIEPVPARANVALYSRFSTMEDAAVEAVSESPAVAAKEKALDAARSGIAREKGSLWPNINLTYSFQHSDVGFDNLRSPARDTSTLALQFNYPLFEGGARSARLKGAWAEYYSAEVALQAAKRSAETQARAAWLNLEVAVERLVATKQAMISSQAQVDSTKKAFKLSTARISDVLSALARNSRARKDHAVAEFQYILGWVVMQNSVGADADNTALELSEALHGF